MLVQTWSGREVRALRESQRLSIREFAARIGVSERMVSRWEAGGEAIRPRPINQEGLDTLLAAASNDDKSRFATRLGSTNNAILILEPTPPDPTVRLGSSSYRQMPVGALTQRRPQGPDVSAMQAFRSADRQVGGGHLYSAVVKYLHTHVGPRLFGGSFIIKDSTVFTAAAGLTEMAGWMAHDAGRDDRAYSHFLHAFQLSRAGHDPHLGIHILASLSHLAHHQNDPHGAIRFAQTGQTKLAESPANPELSARLLAMQAKGRATLGNQQETNALLGRAEVALGGTHENVPSEWVSRFDLGSLASETARCMQQLGKPAKAQEAAHQILALRTSNSTRSRAFGKLYLIETLIDQGELEEACRITREVVDATQSLGSQLVAQRFKDIHDQLTPYIGSPVVRETQYLLADTVRQRVWLQKWITSDASDGQVAPG